MTDENKWCPMCAKWGDHTSGQCPQLAWLREGETVYGIAQETHERYGHGDSGTEERIVREGAYGMGQFPPLFRSRESADRYVALHQHFAGKVVEMKLHP